MKIDDLSRELRVSCKILREICTSLNLEAPQNVELSAEVEDAMRQVCSFMASQGIASVPDAIAAMSGATSSAESFESGEADDALFKTQLQTATHKALQQDLLVHAAILNARQKLVSDAIAFIETPQEGREKFLSQFIEDYRLMVRQKAYLLMREGAIQLTQQGASFSFRPAHPGAGESLNGGGTGQRLLNS